MAGEGGACIICLDASPPPIQSGCACRSDAGLAHLECRVQVAQQAQRGIKVWRQWGAAGGRGWPGCIKTEELFSALPLPAARRPEPQGGRPGACGGYKPAFEKAGAGTPLYKSKGHSWMLGTMPWCFCLLLVATSTKAT